MGRRILAALAAIVMVAVALNVRGRLDNGDSGSGSSARTGALQLICVLELQEVCESIDESRDDVEITVEPALATVERLTDADEDVAVDGWLTVGPWGEVVDITRPQGEPKLFAAARPPLARSRFVVAVWKSQRAKLACPDPVNLGCLGDAVNTRGFRLGVAGDDQAGGVLADAALGVGHSNNPDFATNDLRETDLAEWLAAVDLSTDRVGRNPGGRAFQELLTFGEAAADGYLATEAEIGPQFATAAKRNLLDVVAVVPTATADVLFASRPGGRGDRLAGIARSEQVRALLRANGWRTDGGTPRLPADDGLPSAGVLFALTEITR